MIVLDATVNSACTGSCKPFATLHVMYRVQAATLILGADSYGNPVP